MQTSCKEITRFIKIQKSKILQFPSTLHKRLRCFGFCGFLYAIIAFSFLFTYLIFFSKNISFDFPQSDIKIPQIKSISSSEKILIPTNLSHIIFGLSGSAETWDTWRPYNELWWRSKEMNGYVWLDKKPVSNSSFPDTCTPFKISETKKSIARKARTVVDTYKSMLSEPVSKNIRWFVMGDDDTVFFPENLIAVLRKYDHEQMYYIGSISESVEQVLEFSYNMAFGGAGFAISLPTVVELEKVMEGCLKRYSQLASDRLVSSCLSELGVPLTHEPGFHQVDLGGNIYGSLAAHPLTPLVSLHNLNHINPISPHYKTQYESIKSLVDISKLDSSRTLQQTICYDRGQSVTPWSLSVSWGFTVEIYPWFVPPKDLVRALSTFRTWRNSFGPFTIDTRWRSDWPCDWPLMFSLTRAKVEIGENGTSSTVTEYSRDLNLTEQKCESPFFTDASKVKIVRVIAPKMRLSEWKLAPRRQCCYTNRIDEEALTVRIKNCQPRESSIRP